jgi:hypothetical protein
VLAFKRMNGEVYQYVAVATPGDGPH